MDRVAVEHFDMEREHFTASVDLEKMFAPLGEVWHTVWANKLKDGKTGRSLIQTTWKDGPEVWKNLRFAVLRPTGVTIDPADLPPHARVIDVDEDGASAEIRYQLVHSQVTDRLPPRVASYIQRYELYTLGPPRTKAALNLRGRKVMVIADEWNKKALEWQARLAKIRDDDRPDAIVVIGGDGTMLRAIHDHWRQRVPFVGLNAGHLGFLSNESPELIAADDTIVNKLIVRRLPMLHVTLEPRSGPPIEALSFQDAWVERATGQTAWVRVKVKDGDRAEDEMETKLENVVCDGMLVSTAAGSTAYAQSMGAAPLIADTPAWLLVGSNVMRPIGWKSAILPMDATVRLESGSPERRKLRGFVFNQEFDDVLALEARISRVASIEMAFSEKHDLARKLMDQQFGAVKEI
jgi:NAD kinase